MSRVKSKLDGIALFLLMLTIFLLPIFFLPTLAAPFQFTKTFLLLEGVLIAFLLLIISRLKEGTLSIPLNLIVASSWLLVVAYFLSALFASDSLAVSFIGQQFEVDTVIFVLIMALLLSITPFLVRTKTYLLRIHLVVLLSAAILALYQLTRFIFGEDFLTLGIFTDITTSPIGRWNDLGIFFGLTTILSLFMIEHTALSRLLKIVVGVLLAVSLFMVAVVNFFPVWIAIGVVSLGLFIHCFFQKYSAGMEHESDLPNSPETSRDAGAYKSVSFTSLIVLLVTIVFIVQGQTLGSYLTSVFDIVQLEARPSWTTTISILGETYQTSPILGSGPNTFREQWALFKPVEVNRTPFWNVDFSAGIGTIPTSFVTTGIVGVLAWALFFGLLLYGGFRAFVLRPAKDQTIYQLGLAAFIAAVYLWVLSIIYVPGVALLALAFFFTGLFLAALRLSGEFREKSIVFTNNPRLGFILVLTLTLILIGTVVGVYTVGQRYLAGFHFQRSVVEANIAGDLDKASENLDRAILLGGVDTHYRFASEIGLVRLNQIINQADLTIEERRTQFQNVLSATIRNAQRATEINPGNYQNWFSLGRVYQSVVSLQIEGAYDSAVSAYERAETLAPTSAALALNRAQLELANNNPTDARDFIDKALKLKNNYTEAVFLLSQLQIQAGELTEAVQSVGAATLLEPDNPAVFFQLGLLHFTIGNNELTILALERAVALNDIYSNARYFLGLAYEREGRIEEAIQQFEKVEQFNSDNEEVKTILGNLRAGNPSFENLDISSNIQTRESLPIEGE